MFVSIYIFNFSCHFSQKKVLIINVTYWFFHEGSMDFLCCSSPTTPINLKNQRLSCDASFCIYLPTILNSASYVAPCCILLRFICLRVEQNNRIKASLAQLSTVKKTSFSAGTPCFSFSLL
jgi:hypothetical protein